jgi:hypothetical protein
VLGLIQCAYRPAFKTPVYWYLETYESRAAAETDKGPHGTVVESLGKIWLMTIDEPGRKPPSKGKRVAEIGPLAISAGEKHSRAIHGGSFHTGHDGRGAPAWRTGSLVYLSRGNLLRDFGRPLSSR